MGMVESNNSEKDNNRINKINNLNLEVSQIDMNKLDEVMELYKDAITREYCVWNENYPSRSDIENDISNGDLYGIKDDAGTYVAVVAKDRDEEVDSLPCWSIKPAAELARLVIAREYTNQGLARILIKLTAKELAKRGYKGIHYMVANENIPARKSYAKLEFNNVGEVDMFDEHFICYEKLIDEI